MHRSLRKLSFAAIAAVMILAGQRLATAGPIDEDSWYLPTSDGAAELYVQEMGIRDGPPVVVLHGGWGAEHSYLKPVVARHGGGHRFILYDQRGSLLSPAAAKDLSVAKQVEDLELLRRTLKIEKLTLLCHSMGTYLALEYLERHPDRVEGLILTGAMRAAVPKNGRYAYFERMNAYGRKFSERDSVKEELAAAGDGRGDLSPRERTHLWRIRFAAVNIFHIERWRGMPGGRIFFKQASADAIAATMPSDWNREPLLLSGRYAVTVINGDHDYADQEGYWADLARRSPKVKVVVLKDAGHTPWLDDAEGFHRSLEAALSSQPRETPHPNRL